MSWLDRNIHTSAEPSLKQKTNSESDGWVRIAENFRGDVNCYEEKSSQCSNLSLLQLPQSPDGGPDAGRGHSGVVPGSSGHVDAAVLVVTIPHSDSLDKTSWLVIALHHIGEVYNLQINVQ